MKTSALNPPTVASEEFSRRGADFVPPEAGCYALSNASGDILYIGRAKNLRTRIINHLDDDKKRAMTPLGVVSVFHYALCEVPQLSSLETGWINDFQLAEGGNLPHFNKIRSPS